MHNLTTHALAFTPTATGYAIIKENYPHHTYAIAENGVIHNDQYSPQETLNWFIEKYDPPVLFFGAYQPLDEDEHVKILTTKKEIPIHHVPKREAIAAGKKAEKHLQGFYQRIHTDEQNLWNAFHTSPSIQALCIAFKHAYYEEQKQ